MDTEQQAEALSLLAEVAHELAGSSMTDTHSLLRMSVLGIDLDLPTIREWRERGLLGAQYVQWVLMGREARKGISAQRSVFREEGWILVVDRGEHDTVIADHLKPQQARDLAAWLRGEERKV